jgi:hypothetical protein
MNGETRQAARDERLRSLLREADPAADEAKLTPEETQAMRRAVLTAVPETRRRWLAVPALVGTAMLALTVAVTLMTWPDPEMPTVPPTVPPTESRQVATAAPAPPRAPVIKAAPVERAPAKKPARKRKASPVHSAPEPAATLASSGEPDPEAARDVQIQFATPGGTRIIWVLTSDKTLK